MMRFKLFAAAFAIVIAASPAAAFEIEPVTSDSGIETWLVSEDTVPIVAVDALFHAGSHLDPEGREGLAEMTANLMTEGAGDLDSQAFAARLRDLNVQLSFDAGRDTIQVRLRTLASNMDEAFELLALALTRPRFDAQDVERVRAQMLASLAQDEENPDTVAFRTFFAEAFAGHPYASSTSGTPESVTAITVGDLRTYAAKAFTLDALHVSVVGDISAEDTARLVDTAFASLPATAERNDPTDAGPLEPGVTVIERNNPQTVVVFGMDGLKRDDEDFIPAYVMNYILGGGSFVSRMFDEVREKRGLVYTVDTNLYPLNHGALYFGYLASSNETAGEALDVARAEIARMAEEGVTAEELENAQTYLTGSYALRFDSSRAIAGQLTAIQFEDLGIDYVENRNGMIEAVTRDDIARVAKRLLKPDALRVVAVGQPAGIGEARSEGEPEGEGAEAAPAPEDAPAPEETEAEPAAN